MELPKTISNGQGEELTFENFATDEQGEYLNVSSRVQPGAGPPMHTHHFQDETLTVVSGQMGYQILGEPEQFVNPGESITFKAGQAHRFWAANGEVLRGKGFVRPPDNMMFFLSAIFESAKVNGTERPGIWDSAYLIHRYRSEYTMNELPTPLVKLVFPIVMLIGKLLGKYKKYADAPEPRLK